jgi:hypothetical protein
METYHEDKKEAELEQKAEEREKEEREAYQEALDLFKLSPFYPYLVKMIDDRIKEVTDTRLLAASFGKIKNEVIGELGVLGIASLMASKPLEDLKEELS